MVTIYLTCVRVEVIEAKQILLGRITVFLLCPIVLDQDVSVLVVRETGQSILTAVTSKDNQDTCILDQHVTVGNTMDILQEHLILVKTIMNKIQITVGSDVVAG